MIARVAEYVKRSPPVFYALAFAGSRETGPRTLYRALACLRSRLIPRVNRLPNSQVDSKHEQRRW